jgi:hypothetical protein
MIVTTMSGFLTLYQTTMININNNAQVITTTPIILPADKLMNGTLLLQEIDEFASLF